MIDIILPSSDHGYKHMDLCVRAVERFTHNDHRIIVVNNGSRLPETRKVLDDIKSRGHTVVELAGHVSFSKAINAGLQVSKGEHVCLLNDDVYVIDGWDAQMLLELADPRIGMVGARMPGAAAGFMGDPTFADVLPVNALVFAHVMLRRDVLDKVGVLDSETFDGYGSEDFDYSWRVIAAGYKLKVSAARSLHIGGASMNKLGGDNARMREYERMHQRLISKWGTEHIQKYAKMYPTIACAVPTYNGKVDNDFFQSFAALSKTGPFQLELFQSKRLVVHYARERIAEDVTKAGFDYLWWLDDDMTFPPDTLTRLLAHQKDIVCALAYQRKEPYNICLFDWIPIPGIKEGGSFQSMNGCEHTGLREIAGCGSACTLVSTEVFKKIKAKEPDAKLFESRFFGEDLAFCKKAQEVGYKVFGDTDLIIGHIGDPIVVDEAHVARFKMRRQQDAERLEPLAFMGGRR